MVVTISGEQVFCSVSPGSKTPPPVTRQEAGRAHTAVAVQELLVATGVPFLSLTQTLPSWLSATAATETERLPPGQVTFQQPIPSPAGLPPGVGMVMESP